jgi:hypothetical protein
MTDEKLTDEEIVKAWNEEINLANYVNENYRNGIKVSLIENTLDLINRLQDENERLKKEFIEQNLKNIMRLETSKEIESEAYKEFAERIHCHCESIINQPHNERVKPSSWKVAYEEFDEYNDNLLKELKGTD